MPLTFPNESKEYRAQRNELLQAEADLRQRVEDVSRLRRKLPEGGKVSEDYVFDALDDNGVVVERRMSELFSDGKDTLFLYGFMYGPKMEQACPSCSSIIDAFNGNARHIQENIALVIVARSPIERIVEFAAQRGWDRLTFVSSANNSYGKDYHAESGEGGQLPMANVFRRDENGIHHFWASELMFEPFDGDPRHLDMMWPLWNVLDTTPAGRGDWNPGL